MLIRWTAPGERPREFQFAAARLLSPDVELLESLGGAVWDNFDDFARAFNSRNRRALRAALWVCLVRADGERAPRFDDFEVRPYDVVVDLGQDEIDVLRGVLASGVELDPDQRAAFAEMVGEDPGAPKASPPSGDATAG